MKPFEGFNRDFSLADKVAIITGGAAVIGKAIAELYLLKGARVALLDCVEDIDAIARQMDAEACRGWRCDVREKSAVDSTVAAVAEAFGQIDILVNNAGIVRLQTALHTSLQAWNETLAVNLTAVFLLCQAVGPYLIRQGRGKIINLASQAATVALPDHLAYCTSKAGVIGLSKVLALEWSPLGIQVNSISPTVVLTELGQRAWAGKVGEAFKQRIPARRFADPQEIAACALFLASDATDMITGADLVIDGGFTIQ